VAVQLSFPERICRYESLTMGRYPGYNRFSGSLVSDAFVGQSARDCSRSKVASPLHSRSVFHHRQIFRASTAISVWITTEMRDRCALELRSMVFNASKSALSVFCPSSDILVRFATLSHGSALFGDSSRAYVN